MKRRPVLASLCLLVLFSCAGRRAGAPPRSVERVVTHRVEVGETWASIARDFYGDEDRAGDLAVYNGREPDIPLQPGSGIRIPLTKWDLRSLRGRLDAVTEYNEALSLAAEGNYAGAVEHFQQALEIEPDFSDAAFNLAVTYQKLGLHGKASRFLKDLVEREPDNPEYYYALGNSRFHSDDFEGARRSFLKALSLDPGHLKSLFSLAAACERAGRRDEAVRRWREYLELDPGSEWADEARSRMESLLEELRRR